VSQSNHLSATTSLLHLLVMASLYSMANVETTLIIFPPKLYK